MENEGEPQYLRLARRIKAEAGQTLQFGAWKAVLI